MDKYVPKPGTGSAFINDNKTEEWHGDFKGKIVLPNGDTHYFDVYKAKDKNDKTYLKVKIGKQVVEQPGKYSAAHKPFDTKPKASKGFDDIDSDVPF